MDEYDLGTLLVGDFDGVLRWLVKQGSEWYYGPLVGPAFADEVLAGWSRLYGGPTYEWWV